MQPSEIGTTTTENLGRRDAFHAPCILATGDAILPGDNVKFIDPQFTKVVRCTLEERHGIADPFVKSIPKNHNFWVFLNPNSTANLTHHFDIVMEIQAIEDKDCEEEEEEGYYEYGDDDYRNSCKGCY